MSVLKVLPDSPPNHSVRLAGIDGCRGGWIAAAGTIHRGSIQSIEWIVHKTLLEMLEATGDCAGVALDMPIGLLDQAEAGGRTCDREARRLLGRPRASSVFSPPSRAALGARTFDEVRDQGLTLQAFHILPKIREVDGVLTPAFQERVREFHPELIFMALGGAPILEPKRKRAGLNARLKILTKLDSRLVAAFEAPSDRDPGGAVRVAPDDRIDALVLLIGAFRQWCGEANCLPAQPPLDRRGLRMEILY